jgi:hypothetical protein
MPRRAAASSPSSPQPVAAAGLLFKSVIAVLQRDLEMYESKSSETRELISKLQ